ncbi:MAG: response regulator [Desulfobaccales bacterium]
MDNKSKKILVADDESSMHLLLGEELKEQGYEVFYAFNGREAMGIFKKISIDLVILDIKMPEMDGLEALRQMKEYKEDIPVIFFTAYGEYKYDFATWGADEYLVKSSDLGDLFKCVEYYLNEDK